MYEDMASSIRGAPVPENIAEDEGLLKVYLDSLTETGGVIDRARDRWDAQIDLLKDRIEQFEDRLESREVALRRQYSALESTLARLNSASASLFAALPQGV